ncbi:hypothetical protein AGMMS50262_20810 [Bacteroidia bacterium]|nr:hypothetical protein AGMMS50262_20810 [Bacteroidia bacterium]
MKAKILILILLFTIQTVKSQSFDPKSSWTIIAKTTLPALPYKNIYILIPENTNVENVNINEKSKEIRQDISLINNPVEKPTSTVSNINNRNVSEYSKAVYPDKNVKIETIIKSQGFHLAAFSVCP